MGGADKGDRGNGQSAFELDDEPEPLKHPSLPSPTADKRIRAARGRAAARRAEERDAAGSLAFLDDKRRRRLLIYVPVITGLYVVVCWAFLGFGYGWFILTGAALGLFAAWRQQGEYVLGTLGAVSGFAICLIVVGLPELFTIVSTGLIGFLTGVDDRLRNS